MAVAEKENSTRRSAARMGNAIKSKKALFQEGPQYEEWSEKMESFDSRREICLPFKTS